MDAVTHVARLPFLVCHGRCCPSFKTKAWSGYVAIGGSGNRNHGRGKFSCDFCHESDAL